jgi:hypothetical protein
VDTPVGRDDVRVDPRGREAPIGSNGSRLGLVDFDGERGEWCRSSVDERPILSVPSVSVSCRVKGAKCTGTAECTSEEIIEPGLDGRAQEIGEDTS